MEMIDPKKVYDILIIPCFGDSYLARLVVEAAEELTVNHKVRVLLENEIKDLETVRKAINSSDRCITVDGCHKQCMLEKLKEQKCITEFTLNLTEMGIDDRQQVELDPEDIELAKNSIYAASYRVSQKPPLFPGCCC